MTNPRTQAKAGQLNDITLRNLPIPAAGQMQYPDGKLPGFGVRVTSKGLKIFYLTYRLQGRSRRLMLGRYPYKSLASARADALSALSLIAEGVDPQPEQDAAEVESGEGAVTFEDAVEKFIALYCRHHNRASTAAETERILRAVYLPVWQGRALISIGKADILAILDAKMEQGTPSAAIHAYAVIRKLFGWSVERGLIESSPCLNMKPPARKQSRERVLEDEELATLWKASEEVGYPFGAIFQLLALTAQRRGEVVGMRWSELDLASALWTIPGSRTKNGKPHAVPLSPQVLAILQELPRFSGDLVFPARGKPLQPYSGYSKGKRALDAAAGLHDWTLHDLRRTAATGMARLGIPPHVVEKILNHTTGTFAGVAGVYNRFEYRDEMRDALRQWATHVQPA